MELDSNLIEQVKKGKVVLVFGSGFLYGAEFPEGRMPLLGNDLRDAICDRFLGGDYKSDSLKFVSDLAISDAGLFYVQEYIAEQLEGVGPSEFHKKLTLFRWRALFTTNYDRLVEDTYRVCSGSIQKCKPILSNSDPLDEISRTNEKVPLFKLHGCVSRIRDEGLPLILTVDQYNNHLNGRDRLFSRLYELGYENTIVFVGHSLQDENIRKVIDLIDQNVASGRPKFYLLKPGVKRVEADMWGNKRISALDITFEVFINSLCAQIDERSRTLSLVRPVSEHPIQEKFTEKQALREDFAGFLTNNVDYVHATLSSEGDIRKFYSGANQGWFPIHHSLDCSRSLTDKIIEDAISLGEAERSELTELHVIKGEAGSGKSVLIRRLAWRAANELGRLCLFVRDLSSVKYEYIDEVYRLTKERVFVFWDSAASNSSSIVNLLNFSKRRGVPITIVSCERYTDWNVKCEELNDYVSSFYKLRYLSRKEVEELVDLLEKHRCLGPGLETLSREKRIQKFLDTYDRQLLVALHEVTMGLPFEDIIYDEYMSLQPKEARDLYRGICTLNRFRVPVRAGLIARVYGIGFERFEKEFFRPLEKVVITSSHRAQDAHYSARHSEIAEIVFSRSFEDAQERYHEYIKILASLNISFESDRQSFRSMVRAKSLMELFPDYSDVDSIYKKSLEVVGREAYLLQQMANFERIRPNGNLRKASELLQEAIELAPRDMSLLHSLAVIWRSMSEKAEAVSEKERYRQEAKSILNNIITSHGHSAHIDSVLVELELARLKDVLIDKGSSDRLVDMTIRNADKVVSECKKRFPVEDYIATLEADFADLVKDEKRAVQSLEKAFERDSRDPFVAIRLSSVYFHRGDVSRAKEVLDTALSSRRGDQRLNFSYAELLRKSGGETADRLRYFYQRAFTPGDKNYQSQFWFARYAIESDDRDISSRAAAVFEGLRKASVGYEIKQKIRDYFGGEDAKKEVRGKLSRRCGSFGFVKVEGFISEAFIHEDSVQDGMWEVLIPGDELVFYMGFSYNGLVCQEVKIL
ncbi:SIR2 family protein [Halomonas cupida]|uniref:P-loop NTPase n=1 Tax=Halomonas cupida TaxID=44933 RepID=UPI003EF309B6